MNKKIILSVVVASTVVFSSSLLAQSSLLGQFLGQGFSKKVYLGVGGGASLLEPDTDAVAGLDVADDTDSVFNVTLGFDFSRRLTAEIQYADLGTAGLTDGDGIEYTVASASGLVYLYNVFGSSAFLDQDGLDRRTGLSLYGRLGIGNIENDAEQTVAFERDNDVQFVAGVGLEYGLGIGIGLRAEYISYDSDADYAGLTLLYRYGGGLLGSGGFPDLDGLDELPIELPSQPAPPLPAPPAVITAPPVSTEDLLQDIESDSSPQFVDVDNDGVLDDIDECPATPAGNPVDPFGCEVFNRVIEGINFLPGSDTLTAGSLLALSTVVDTLLANPNVRISVQAHTDNQGDDDFNFALSRNRAISVVKYLLSQSVPLSQLEARAFGETEPVADNNTRAGRLLNRRVEFKVIQ